MEDEVLEFDPSIAAEFGNTQAEGISETFLGVPILDTQSLYMLLLRFAFNLLVSFIIVQFFYYPKGKRRDFYFTFMLFSVTIFLLIYLLGSIKMQIGLVLGLFAIFGIIRYRTEQISIREMTYLFVIMGLSVINGLATTASYVELIVSNSFFLLVIWALESKKFFRQTCTKLVLYEKIDMIVPEKEAELIADLKKRTGLNILKIQIGHIDFLRDVAFIKLIYLPKDGASNDVDQITNPKQYTQE